MKEQRDYILGWLTKTIKPRRIDWQNDSRCIVEDTQGRIIRVWFLGRNLMADYRHVGRLQSPRERIRV